MSTAFPAISTPSPSYRHPNQHLCQKRGLSGEQGVIIPRANVRHLMLKQAVLDSAASGRFHIYAVDHVEQALELLMDMPAGQADSEGLYPAGTFNHLVQLRLTEWVSLRQHYATPSGPTQEA